MAIKYHPLIVKNIVWHDESATRVFAEALAARPALADALVELRGDLGAGKTTFVRHLLKALGVQGRVKSPTYAVVEPYNLPALNVWHFDFYRFNDPDEWEEAGFRDIFAGSGLKLVEWPDKAGDHLPAPDLLIELEVGASDSREVRLSAFSQNGATLLA